MVEDVGPVFEILDEGCASLDFFGDDYGVAGVDSAAEAAVVAAAYCAVGADTVEFGFFAGHVDSAGEGEVVVDFAVGLEDEGVLLVDCSDDVDGAGFFGDVDGVAVFKGDVGEVVDGDLIVLECEDDAAFGFYCPEFCCNSALGFEFACYCGGLGGIGLAAEALFGTGFDVFFVAIDCFVDFLLLLDFDTFAFELCAVDVGFFGCAAYAGEEGFEGFAFFEFEYAALIDFAVNADEFAFGFDFERGGSGGEDADDVGRLYFELGEFLFD